MTSAEHIQPSAVAADRADRSHAGSLTAGPDARPLLEAYPERWDDKSFVVDAALDDFLYRQHRGERVDPAEYGERFPQFRSSLEKVFLVYQLAEPNVPPPPAEPARWPEPGETFLGFTLVRLLGR